MDMEQQQKSREYDVDIPKKNVIRHLQITSTELYIYIRGRRYTMRSIAYRRVDIDGMKRAKMEQSGWCGVVHVVLECGMLETLFILS